MTELPQGVYQRGKDAFQAKVKLGDKRHTGSFKSSEAAAGWIALVKSEYKLGKPLTSPEEYGSTSTLAANTLTIQAIYDRVWAKRWRYQKSAEDGSPGNAKRFVKWCGPEMSAKEALQEDHVLAFLDEKALEGVSDNTLTHYQAAIGPLLNEAMRLKIITLKPEFPKRRQGLTRLRVLDEEEERVMLKVMRLWGFDKHAYLFEFLLDTGVRPGEAQKLKWEDFEPSRVHLESDITKNSTRRTLGLTARAQRACAAMRQYGLAGPFTWAQPKMSATRNLIERLRTHFEWGEDFVVYTFRHTCLSRLVRRGVDLYRVQIWAGHKSITQTQRYAKFAPKQITDLAGILEGNPADEELH